MMHCQYLPNSSILEMTSVRKTSAKTITTFWYFNTACWLKSSNGEKGERPLEVMSQEQIDWVKKHCIPKARQATPSRELEAA